MSGACWSVEWQLIKQSVPFSADSSTDVGMVVSETGDNLRVYVDDVGDVRGLLSLRTGFESFVGGVCPTYQVDDGDPLIVGRADSGCVVDTDQTLFIFGRKANRRVRSTALYRIMNGRKVVFRFQLQSVGCREVVFSLRRSKHAVEGAVGRGTRIEKES